MQRPVRFGPRRSRDEDCDGSDYLGVPVGSAGRPTWGTADDITFGEVVRVGDEPGAILVSETAIKVGKFGGGDDPFAAPAGTVLHHEDAAEFGLAVGAVPLEGGGRATCSIPSAPSRSGCWWASAATVSGWRSKQGT